MKSDRLKSWPHPVLRKDSKDYQNVEFQVTFDELDRRIHTTEFGIDVSFALSDPDLLQLIEHGHAEYAILAVCSRTHYRRVFSHSDDHIRISAADGEIAGTLELTPFIVAVRELPQFSGRAWHTDYQGREFRINSGAVLAIDDTAEYLIDLAEEAPVSSCIAVSVAPHLDPGRWNCGLDDERIMLQMSVPDYESFLDAREAVKSTPDAMYIMNAIYLPGLIYAMTQADQSPQDYESLRWYRSVDARLADLELPPLGTQGADRVLHAQTIFGWPFAKMPLLQAPALTERAGA